jgi:hypothetical protein
VAVVIPEHNAIFVHVPKTGGTSMQRWLLDNIKSNVLKGNKHHTFESLNNTHGPFDFSFTIVRNPWDWCVSWYFFRRDRALRRIKNPKEKGKFSLEYNKKVLEDFDKGFDYFIETTTLQPQCIRTTGVEKILKLETIDSDIIPLADKFKIKEQFPLKNKSNRNTDYRNYYNSNTKNIVSKKFAKDIELFEYSF